MQVSPAACRSPLQRRLPRLRLRPGLLSHPRHPRLVQPHGRASSSPSPAPTIPDYVQTNAVWSPPTASTSSSPAPPPATPTRPARSAPLYANDPNETQIQYDLYRIPFNDGRGGTPERIAGASQNGMSNNFPKVSPDGKWIVFVQCKNGLLMRPDSKLFIVPVQPVAKPAPCAPTLRS